jgi:hypothetical protein
MITPSRLRRVASGVLVATAAVAIVSIAPSAASASTAGTLTVDGRALEASTRSNGVFTVTANAPAGVAVKFKIDGVYLGKDDTAPYSWPIGASAGVHEIDARWSGGDTSAEFVVSSGAAPSAPAPGAPAPAPAPAAGPGSTVSVSTAAGLTSALAAARPGQTISLADGTYTGRFEAAASGTAGAPITLTGSSAAVLSTGSLGSGYALHITGDRWNVRGLSVSTAAKGIVLDGSTHTVVSGVDVGRIGQEGVHFRAGSSDGLLENSTVHDTGLTSPQFGEGVYIGSAAGNWADITGSATTADASDRVVVRGNTIASTPGEGVDVKEGSSGGTITGNRFHDAGHSGLNSADSWIDLKGNGYTVSGNSGSGTLRDAVQVHEVLAGWGRGNSVSGTTVTGGVPGHEVWAQSASLGTLIACKSSAAGAGLTNLTCS